MRRDTTSQSRTVGVFGVTFLLCLLTLMSCEAKGANEATGAGASDTNQMAGRTCFQTGKMWSPQGNVGSDVAIAYGIDTNLPARMESWREHGYRIEVMTGASWGKYQDYLYGRFDGIHHEDEAQTERDGHKIGHGGDMYYMCPGTNYGKFLCVGVQRALDAGAEAIHLEEPEFWDRAGYSEGFKREWRDYYHEDWQAPHSSVDARWRAGKLKYFLYRRALQQVFDYVHAYNQRTGKHVRCYVPTHSLLNYAQWCIVSPESSLAQLTGCDGYIGQVWTGTAREPNRYRDQVRSRTFETAFLEYGALQNLVRMTGKQVRLLNDPIEDNPNYDWADYHSNWEATLTAALFQPDVYRYEVAPWPERVFRGRFPRSAKPDQRQSIPASYATELQIVFNALNDMKQARVEFDGGLQGVGVLASDSMMFQRGEPTPSDPYLGNFYGLAMPLLKRGIPVRPVQLENIGIAHYLDEFRILYLSYDGQKPLSPEVHQALAEWVRNGGALIFCDKDADPYLKVREWWNSDGRNYATPREHLFEMLGLNKMDESLGFKAIGHGGLIWLRERPVTFSQSREGAPELIAAGKLAASKIGLAWREASHLILRRGPYVIAAGLDEPGENGAEILRGNFVSLFDAELSVQKDVRISKDSRCVLLDLDAAKSGGLNLLATAGRTRLKAKTERQLSYTVTGVGGAEAVMLFEAPLQPKGVTLDGKPVGNLNYSEAEKLLWIRFEHTDREQELSFSL